MLGKRSVLDTTLAENETNKIRRLLKAVVDLAEQVRRLNEEYETAQQEMHLTPENVRKVVEVGLKLANQIPLEPVELPDVGTAYRVPVLTGAWSECLKGLEHPFTKEPRPIVFDPKQAEGRDTVVLAHLNHRLVAMCLGLLRAAVWERDQGKIKRITVKTVSRDLLDTPAVIVHGRLLVLGKTMRRLHEELLVAGGKTVDNKWVRFTEAELKQIVARLEKGPVSDRIIANVRAKWPQLEPILRRTLEARMKERTATLDSRIEKKRDSEKAEIQKILEELRNQLQQGLEKPDQLELDFGELDRADYSNLLRHRISQIPEEIKREQAALDERYAAALSRRHHHRASPREQPSGGQLMARFKAGQHDWISLLDISGPFLSLTSLGKAFPMGLETLEKGLRQQFQLAYEEWYEQTDKGIHQAWITWVLKAVLEYDDEVLLTQARIPDEVKFVDEASQDTVRPTFLVIGNQGDARLPILAVPKGQKLGHPLHGHRWVASPNQRMQSLLKASQLTHGLVTNGSEWNLIHVREGDATGYITFRSDILADEEDLLRAFTSLLGIRRIVGTAVLPELAGDPSRRHVISPSIRLDEIDARLFDLRDEIRDAQRWYSLTGEQEHADAIISLKSEQKELSLERSLILSEALLSAQVVIATVYHWGRSQNIKRRDNDLLILDEASMIPIVTTTIILRHQLGKSKWPHVVALGDFRQLPPVLVDHRVSEAENKRVDHWFAQSLFEAAGCLDPEIRAELRIRGVLEQLTRQHRMHPEIAEMISESFYEGRLTTDYTEKLQRWPDGWPVEAMLWIIPAESLEKEVYDRRFLAMGDRAAPSHALLIKRLVDQLDREGFGGEIAILSPYRDQSALLQREILHPGRRNVSVGTIHRMQGSEADLVIVDTVDPLADFVMRSPRLMNVAMSRARRQLIVVGNSAMPNNPHLERFTKAARKWVPTAPSRPELN